MSMTAEQCRAARALLGWSQDDLATQSTVAKPTIAGFESGRRQPYPRTLADIRRALEAGGVSFLASGEASPGGGPGVRLDAVAAESSEA